MFDVVALGEVLIDFTPYGLSEGGQALFEQNPGGAPANVLAALARLGCRTAFIGKVGEDMHGRMLKETLEANGIDTSGMIVDDRYFTTLAFVALKNGERDFSFARKPGADTQLEEGEIRTELLENTRIFHCGSLSLTDEPARSATFCALKKAKEAGALISYDPNYRAPLWKSREAAMEQMRAVIPWVDIMKISDEETGLLTGYEDPEEAAGELIRQGVTCAVVTLGGDGALLRTENFTARARGRKRQVVDTTGAGDSFWAGILYSFARSEVKPENLTEEQGQEFVRFANAVAGLCVERRGGIPAMPSLEEVQREL